MKRNKQAQKVTFMHLNLRLLTKKGSDEFWGVFTEKTKYK